MANNYSAQMAQLNLSPLMEGVQAARTFKAQSDARADAQRRFEYAVQQDQAGVARRQAFSTQYGAALQNPSQAAFDKLRADYPDFHEPIDNGWKSYTSAQQNDLLSASGSIVAALANNQPQLALKVLDTRRQALTKSNVDTTETDAMRSMIQSGDPVQIKAARGIAGMILAQASGDKFDQVWARLNKVDNDEELQPDRQRAAAADADWKETRARYAPARERSAVDRAQASADDARSRKARRDSLPARQEGRTQPRPPGPAARAGAAPARASRQPTATGPDGRKYVVRGGKWVPMS